MTARAAEIRIQTGEEFGSCVRLEHGAHIPIAHLDLNLDSISVILTSGATETSGTDC
jgi:hypothetical protein